MGLRHPEFKKRRWQRGGRPGGPEGRCPRPGTVWEGGAVTEGMGEGGAWGHASLRSRPPSPRMGEAAVPGARGGERGGIGGKWG